MKSRVLGMVAAVLIAGTSAAGCSVLDRSSDHTLVEIGKARTEIDGLIDGTTKAISPSLKYADGPFTASVNEKPVSRDADGTAGLDRRRYVLTKVAAAKQGKLLDKVKEYWKAQGYKVDAGDSDSAGASTKDGVSVTVMIGATNNVTIRASAQVKDPKTGYPFGSAPSPLPTDAKGNLDTAPKYDDPEWSH